MQHRLVWLRLKRIKSKLLIALFGLLVGVLALGVASIGTYGVVAYRVTSRRHEIGIRMALGAKQADVLGMVTRSGLTLVFGGLVIGSLVAVWLARYLEALLFGVSGMDPGSYGAVAVVLLLTGTLACLVPAIRAARLNPTQTLSRGG